MSCHRGCPVSWVLWSRRFCPRRACCRPQLQWPHWASQSGSDALLSKNKFYPRYLWARVTCGYRKGREGINKDSIMTDWRVHVDGYRATVILQCNYLGIHVHVCMYVNVPTCSIPSMLSFNRKRRTLKFLRISVWEYRYFRKPIDVHVLWWLQLSAFNVGTRCSMGRGG